VPGEGPSGILYCGLPYEYGDPVSKRAIDAVFESMFILTDLRVLLRETAPLHRLDQQQREAAEALITGLQQQVNALREELLL